MRKDNMLSYMPKHLSNANAIRVIVNTEGQDFDDVYYNVDDIKAQLSVGTATWGLDIYEKEYGIKTDLNKSYAERRSIVKSRMRGTGKVDSTLIKLVVDSFTNGQVDVSFSDSTINIKFNGQFGTPPNMTDVYSVVDDIKPAHLAVAYAYRYLLIENIHDVMTLSQMEALTLDKFAGGE